MLREIMIVNPIKFHEQKNEHLVATFIILQPKNSKKLNNKNQIMLFSLLKRLKSLLEFTNISSGNGINSI